MSNFEIFLHVGLGLIGEIAVLVIANLTHCDFMHRYFVITVLTNAIF